MDTSDMMLLSALAAVTGLLSILWLMTLFTLRIFRRLRYQRDTLRRMELYASRPFQPCLKCKPEGRLCEFHQAEVVIDLMEKVR